MEEKVLTKKELAELLQTSTRTIDRNLAEREGEDGEIEIFGRFIAFRVRTRWRFIRKEIPAALESEAA